MDEMWYNITRVLYLLMYLAGLALVAGRWPKSKGKPFFLLFFIIRPGLTIFYWAINRLHLDASVEWRMQMYKIGGIVGLGADVCLLLGVAYTASELTYRQQEIADGERDIWIEE